MSNELTVTNLQDMAKLAQYAAASGFFKQHGGEAAIFSIMMYANELGLGPWKCLFGGMHCIKGKVELSATMMNMLMRKAGHTVQALESTNEKCVIKGTRGDTGETMIVSFSVDDAKKAGIFSGAWNTYPSDMCFARAISRLCRRLAPDVIGTSYVEGEISGIEAQVVEQEEYEEQYPQSSEPEKVVLTSKQIEEFVETSCKLHPRKDKLKDYLEYCQDKVNQTVTDWFLKMSASKEDEVIKSIDRWVSKNG